ncbi:arsenate reductase ArsC [Azospirillum halopraeferens]|uniref:arsenate reductase ArsC n=1 Tax=Azospirillum halopraeferens TaxID=34010 RepID=UPI000424E281|nr:arsenate reductase ArsC [Azospirillum halopraeferens]
MSATPDKTYTVLFLCEHNSGRSIMAECLLRRWSNGRFAAHSAGSRPSGAVSPYTLRILQSFNHKTDGLHSKSWDVYTGPDAPAFDFVFTLCDTIAAASCPEWPGRPMTAHWGIEDPSATDGGEERILKAYRRAYVELESRIKIFSSLRVTALDRLGLQSRLNQIGSHRAERDELVQAGAFG